MDTKTRNELEKAREHFQAFRMTECYAILRRYFDRIPFNPEKEHAEFIAIFTRLISELGKQFEFKFYISALEKWANRNPTPEILYQLALLYINADPPQIRSAKSLLERIISDTAANVWHVKAKLSLAYCFDVLDDNVAACRKLIDSIEPPAEAQLNHLYQVWKAKILRDENHFEGAEFILKNLFEVLTPEKDWYGYFSAQVILAGGYIRQDKMAEAKGVIDELKKLFDDKPLKTVARQISAIGDLLKSKEELGTIRVDAGGDGRAFVYLDKTFRLGQKSVAEKLLVLLLEKRFVDKRGIVEGIYRRPYNSESDDKLIYYHIHTVRKLLTKMGVPAQAVASESSGYRLVPEVQVFGGKDEVH